MAESMTPDQIIMQEMHNTGTTWTRNDFMEKNGYLVIKNLWDPEELSHPVPIRRGQFNYCLLYTSPSPRDLSTSRMPSSA